MAKERIMLLGANGQIGQTLRYVFDHMDQKPDWEIGSFTRQEFDMTDPMAMRYHVQAYAPSLIINCAAMIQLDQAEQDETAAMAINFNAVANLAAMASAQDIPVIHLSTGYVFDGHQDAPFTTEDQMNPVTVYGGTKMMGEEALRHAMPWHVILRVSCVLGPFGGVLSQIIDMLNQFDELPVAADNITCPTPAFALCRTIIDIGKRILHGKTDGFGTFHYCGKPPCSRYEMTKAIMQTYAPFTDKRPKILKAHEVTITSQTTYPPSSILDCEKIKRIYDIDQPIWQDELSESINLLLTK